MRNKWREGVRRQLPARTPRCSIGQRRIPNSDAEAACRVELTGTRRKRGAATSGRQRRQKDCTGRFPHLEEYPGVRKLHDHVPPRFEPPRRDQPLLFPLLGSWVLERFLDTNADRRCHPLGNIAILLQLVNGQHIGGQRNRARLQQQPNRMKTFILDLQSQRTAARNLSPKGVKHDTWHVRGPK